MEMEIRPVEADLQEDVKIGQGVVGSYEKAPPEHRVNPANPNVDIVSFGLRIVFHYGPAYRIDNASALPSPRFEMLSYYRINEGPHSVEPDLVLGVLRQSRQGSGHQPHATGAPDRDARGLRPLSGSHRAGGSAGSSRDAIARLVLQGAHGCPESTATDAQGPEPIRCTPRLK